MESYKLWRLLPSRTHHTTEVDQASLQCCDKHTGTFSVDSWNDTTLNLNLTLCNPSDNVQETFQCNHGWYGRLSTPKHRQTVAWTHGVSCICYRSGGTLQWIYHTDLFCCDNWSTSTHEELWPPSHTSARLSSLTRKTQHTRWDYPQPGNVWTNDFTSIMWVFLCSWSSFVNSHLCANPSWANMCHFQISAFIWDASKSAFTVSHCK